MQYTRLMKRAAQDIANGRGDWKTNWSKLIYYSTIQNFIFNAMQQALFAIGFGEDEVEEVDKKVTGVANGMVDSVLRGTGIYGNVAMMGKNVAREIIKQSDKPRPDYDKAIDKIFSISPPISSKLSRLRQASYTFENEMDDVRNEGLSMDNPGIMATAQIISATTNVPLDRVIRLFDNYRAAVAEDTEAWQRVALILGWGTWELGVEDDNEGLKLNKKKLNHSKFKKKKFKRKKLK